MNSRRAAAFEIARWIATHGHPGTPPAEPEDVPFAQDIVYTAIRRFRPLRSILGSLVVKWPKGEMEALLLAGAAQIMYMPSVPDFAAVNETVEAAKMCSNKSIAKVVNAVLRNLIRRRPEFEARLAAASLAERESFPDAVVDRWIARYGEENAKRLCEWHNTPADTYLAYPPGGEAPFVKLPHGSKVTDAEGFAEGRFIVQDPSTAGAIALLDVKPGMKILDFCAAPGGKTVQTAWRLAGPGAGSRLVAVEVNPHRRRTLEENLKRLGLDWVEVMSAPPRTDAGTFDRVLADVPCSNSGVLRRRPDARWRWSEARLRELSALQREILAAAAGYVAPGGTLVYSTCSNEPEENGEAIEAFLASHPRFRETGRRESVPFESGFDGAFACALANFPA